SVRSHLNEEVRVELDLALEQSTSSDGVAGSHALDLSLIDRCPGVGLVHSDESSTAQAHEVRSSTSRTVFFTLEAAPIRHLLDVAEHVLQRVEEDALTVRAS